MACKIGLIIYCILQCIASLFILVGTPIDQFRSKGVEVWGNGSCLTFFGYKTECYSTTYNQRPPDLFGACSARKSRFQAAEAFSIISIFVVIVAAVFGFIQLCCCRCFRWICLVLNIVAVITTLICWACMASEYSNGRKVDNINFGAYCGKLSATMKYGAGFALYVVGWILLLANIVFIMLPC